MIMQDPLKGDDHRAALTALRDILADHLRLADPSVSAQIAARLQSVLSELASMREPDEESASDDIARRREARRAAAAVGEVATGTQDKQRRRSG